MSDLRDYLAEATGFVGAPEPLEKLLRTRRSEVMHNLVRVLTSGRGVQSSMVRKAAAYALGQIGDPSTLDPLRGQFQVEEVPGVRDAIAAAATAVNVAPDGPSHSQLERRQIISDVYDGRRPADFMTTWTREKRGTVTCAMHPSCTETIMGRCRECVVQEIHSTLSDFAYGRGTFEVDTGKPPLAYVPLIPLSPEDCPWLHDQAAVPDRVRTLRNMIAFAYVLYAKAMANEQDFILAGNLAGQAASFEPDDHLAWWEIHYMISSSVKDQLVVLGRLSDEPLTPDTRRKLTTVAYHMAIALAHLDKVDERMKGTFIRDEVEYAPGMLRDLRESGYCEVDPSRFAPSSFASYSEYLVPGVPIGPDLS